jgi:hypothetical protein
VNFKLIINVLTRETTSPYSLTVLGAPLFLISAHAAKLEGYEHPHSLVVHECKMFYFVIYELMSTYIYMNNFSIDDLC